MGQTRSKCVMSVISWIKGVIQKMFGTDIKAQFGAEAVASSEMTAAVCRWMNVYQGLPGWTDDEIKTINFAKTICSETARLTTLAIGINISGSTRASWLQEQVNRTLRPRLRWWVEYGCAGGTVIFKPNGQGIDVVTPDRFIITEYDSAKKITGIVFQDTYTAGKDIYSKLEYHRFEGNTYRVSTKAFRSQSKDVLGTEIPLTQTRWAEIQPEAGISTVDGKGIRHMLFGVLTMPEANNIDLDSPLGMSLFSGAMEELKDLDIAYSRNAWELDNSNSIELIDDALIMSGNPKKKKARTRFALPSHVHNITGNNAGDFYQSVDRPLKTDMRKIGINQQLSFIGYKCGYSNGYFVFDEKTGMATATQVESDDRRTIQLIKDIRDQLQSALDDTIYAMGVFADLYGLAPTGTYETAYDFGDITYNEDEDRSRNYQLMIQGIIPKWYYLMKWEGFSEADARKIAKEAQTPEREGLFAGQEGQK